MAHPPPPTSNAPLRWDVFCRVIDNFGDIGVCWRLCAALAARGHAVRLWTDDGAALTWMAPGARDGAWPGVQVLGWDRSKDTAFLRQLTTADVWIEGFGCEIAPEFIASHAAFTPATACFLLKIPVWINLEYLSAEGYVERSHGLSSPIMSGPGKGQTRHFYYPGFSARTGGLIREPDLLARVAPLKAAAARHQWLDRHGIAWQDETLVSLFCYEPDALWGWLEAALQGNTPTLLLVTAGRATAEVRRLLAHTSPPNNHLSRLTISYLPPLSQPEYDALLAICDLNFVRGEDSLVRAIWAGKPFVWQIYPQADQAHHGKLEALIGALGMPGSLASMMRYWNGLPNVQAPDTMHLPPHATWTEFATRVSAEQFARPDLVTQLIDFVHKKR